MEVAKKRIQEWNTDSLDALDLSHLNLSELPKIPDYVTRLDCSFNTLITINHLPKKLEYLNCANNRLQYISKLPSSLKYLNISGNPKLSIDNKDITIIQDVPLSIEDVTDELHEGKCFDWDLMEDYDIKSYLISSKDNIIINYKKEKILCYSRRLFKNNESHLIKNQEYYTFLDDTIFKNIIISRKTLNYLLNTHYDIYNFIFSQSMNLNQRKYELYEIESFRLTDL